MRNVMHFTNLFQGLQYPGYHGADGSVQSYKVSLDRPVPYPRPTQDLMDFPRTAWITQTNMVSPRIFLIIVRFQLHFKMAKRPCLVIQKFGSSSPKSLACSLLRNVVAHVHRPRKYVLYQNALCYIQLPRILKNNQNVIELVILRNYLFIFLQTLIVFQKFIL